MNDLARYAATDQTSRGRSYQESEPAYRGEFQRDRDRIIHCAAFRRLEYKTQVFVNHEGDMYRTRLTHSIEVAQIARTVARALRLSEDLTEAIALAHDLGHTPFGHAGQDALNRCMHEYGGFEHNLQSLRVVDELEERYAAFPGLNLTFETREGILKHCPVDKAKELGALGERFIGGGQPSLEAQVTNLADEIAYNNHDVDDGLRAGLLNIEEVAEITLFRRHYLDVVERWPRLSERRVIHEVIRRMINHQVVDLIETSRAAVEAAGANHIEHVRQSKQPFITFSPQTQTEHRELQRFLHRHLYRHFRVHRMSRKAGHLLQALFDAFLKELDTLPPEAQKRTAELEKSLGRRGRARGVADYIAGMTDRYAIAEYERMFAPAELT